MRERGWRAGRAGGGGGARPPAAACGPASRGAHDRAAVLRAPVRAVARLRANAGARPAQGPSFCKV